MKKISILVFAVLVSSRLLAQIDPTVEVNRRYEVRPQDISKPTLNLFIADSLEKFDVSFDYSIFNRQYKDLYEFSPYESSQLKIVEVPKTPLFYARIGAQYPMIPSAELYLQGGKTDGLHAALFARHSSFWGQIPDTYTEGNMKNSFGGTASYAWKTGEVIFDIQYDYNKFKYSLAEDSEVFDDHNNSSLNLNVNLKSANADDNSVYYDVALGFRNGQKNLIYDDPDWGSLLEENHLRFGGNVGATFDKHRIFIDMDIEFSTYSECRDFSAGVVELSPIYQYRNKWLDAKLGIKFGNYYMIKGKEIDVDMENDNATNFFPDIDARFSLVDKIFWVHALIGGGNDLNSYVSMLDRCPYISTETDLELSTRPIDTKLALEMLIFGKFNLNLFGIYTLHDNKAVFKPSYWGNATQDIKAEYMDMSHLGAGVELFWDSQDVTAGGSLSYNVWKDREETPEVVTEMPKLEGDAFFRYNFRDRIIAQVDCSYRSEVSGTFADLYGSGPWTGDSYSYAVDAIVDLGFNLNFRINKHFAVYGKIGNILDKRNQYTPYYIEPGRNYGGGLCVSF